MSVHGSVLVFRRIQALVTDRVLQGLDPSNASAGRACQVRTEIQDEIQRNLFDQLDTKWRFA